VGKRPGILWKGAPKIQLHEMYVMGLVVGGLPELSAAVFIDVLGVKYYILDIVLP